MQTKFNDKILVVDDEMAQRTLLRINLEQNGYEVLEAENGKEALQICQNDPHLRLLVTDLLMPDMDGYELIQAIRTTEIRYTYILVLSSLEEKDSVLKALSLGADDYITKPVWGSELELRLNAARRLLNLESRDELIFSMAKLSEYRSEETGYHLDRVRLYTHILAKHLHENYPELGLTARDVSEISNVSTLHDIGKVAIPDNILHKPGKLTEEEFEHMKRHAFIGGQLLKEMYEKSGSNYQKTAYEIAMYHHERWNGKGYPEGLSGKDIPLSARIMALADVYDAISSKRSYKDDLGHEATKQIIVNEKGKHFDPLIVEAFLKEEQDWIKAKNQFQEGGKNNGVTLASF